MTSAANERQMMELGYAGGDLTCPPRSSSPRIVSVNYLLKVCQTAELLLGGKIRWLRDE